MHCGRVTWCSVPNSKPKRRSFFTLRQTRILPVAWNAFHPRLSVRGEP